METDIWAEEGISNLLHAFLALETEQEAQVFLRDLFTAKELREFGRRWQAARMLKDRVPYVQIE